MSLGDYVRYLRALKGGPDYSEIAAACGIDPVVIHDIEQRYRMVGSDDDLAKLAAYFDVPVEALARRRERYRKALSRALWQAQTEERSIRLTLRSGPTFEGRVRWWDLGATELELADHSRVVIQRHAVDDWLVAPSGG